MSDKVKGANSANEEANATLSSGKVWHSLPRFPETGECKFGANCRYTHGTLKQYKENVAKLKKAKGKGK